MPNKNIITITIEVSPADLDALMRQEGEWMNRKRALIAMKDYLKKGVITDLDQLLANNPAQEVQP